MSVGVLPKLLFLLSDSFWHLLTAYDSSWQILSAFDSRWQLLTAHNIFWHLLTAYDSLWQLMSAYDSLCQLTTSFDIFWHLLTAFDSLWQLMAAHDSFLQFLTVNDSFWEPPCLSSSQELRSACWFWFGLGLDNSILLNSANFSIGAQGGGSNFFSLQKWSCGEILTYLD